MKIAVYGVARDEENNIKEWFESSKDADFHLILDTGSKDNTVSIAKDLGVSVHEAFFSPWDESGAKNVAMSLLPKDIDLCILLDLDQRICTENWKNILIENLSGKQYSIIQHDLIDNIDIINDNVNRIPIKNIHSRQNCSWHRYRPRIETIIKANYDNTVYVPINICNMLGNEKRYVDREFVYLDSWEVEYQKTKSLIKDTMTPVRYLLEIVAHQAFTFFEVDKIDKFLEKQKEYFELRKKHVSTNIMDDIVTIYNYDSRFLFANSLLDPKNSEKHLNSINQKSLYYFNSIVKLDIINFWKNGIVSNNIKNLSSFEKIVAYADSKTGRHKVELAKQAYKYFSGKEYTNEEN